MEIEKEKDVLLIAIYSSDSMNHLEDIGICYIDSYLKKKGYNTFLLSTNMKKFDIEQIKKYNPKSIGFSLYMSNQQNVFEIARQIKIILPKTYIFVGGPQATHKKAEILKVSSFIDFVIKGEGEITTSELIFHICNGKILELRNIKGLLYRNGDEIIETPNRELISELDELPPPSRNILTDNHLKIASVSMSRGCMSRCSFCSNGMMWKKWRTTSVKYSLDEIASLVNEHQINLFNFIDNSLEDHGIEFLYDFANGIINRRLKIYYFANFRADFIRIADDALINRLKESGLCVCCVGLEAGNTADLKTYSKIAHLDENYQIVKLLKKHDIYISPGFINFNPFSTLDRLAQNIEFLYNIGFASYFYITTRYASYGNVQLDNKIIFDNLHASNHYGYFFKDKKVERLFQYLNQHLNVENWANISYIWKINDEVMGMIYVQEQIAKNKYGEIIVAQIKDYRNKMFEIINNINEINYLWIKELLILAEKDSTQIEWDEVTSRYASAKQIAFFKEKMFGLISRMTKFYIKNNCTDLLVSLGGNYN